MADTNLPVVTGDLELTEPVELRETSFTDTFPMPPGYGEEAMEDDDRRESVVVSDEDEEEN